MLGQILGIIFPIFAIAAAGYLYGRWKRPDISALNQINMDVLLPCLIVYVVSQKEFGLATYAPLALGAAAVVLGSGLLALPVARALGVPWRTLVPPMMFTNYGNMGLPLAVFAFGERMLPAMVVMFLVGNTLHFTLGTWIMNHRARPWHVLRIPMVMATLTGLTLNLAGVAVPATVDVTLRMLGEACIPLMLFSLGVRLNSTHLSDLRVAMVGAVLCPLTGLLIAVPLMLLLGLPREQQGIFLLFAALPPAVLNYMVAELYNQEPQRVASIVMVGNLAALVTIPAVLAVVLS